MILFNNVSDSWGTGAMKGYYNGSAAYADLDNDGNIDLVMNCLNAPAIVLKNNTAAKKFLSLSFQGEGMNRFLGIGAKAYLWAHQSKTGMEKLQYQELMLTRGFESSSDTRLYFGLDSLSADSLLIVWPRSEIPADQKNCAG